MLLNELDQYLLIMEGKISKEEINGRELIKLINENIKKNNSSSYLSEYDILPMFDEPSQFFNLVEHRYLIINKSMCTNFYFFWRNKFFQNKNNFSDNTLEELDLISKCILLINPNFSSAWSRRKVIASRNLDSELEFNRLILSKHYKCEQAFIHRRWAVKKILNLKEKKISDIAFKEIDFVLDFLSPKIKSNYYCWSYLIWLLNHVTKIDTNYLNLIELNCRLEDMLYKNPSDNCVFHFRLEYFFKYFLKFQSLNDKIILDEINLILDLILRFPQFSTSWNYGKYFLRCMKPFFADYNKNENILRSSINLTRQKILTLYPRHNTMIDLEENSSIINLMISVSNLAFNLNENKLNSIDFYSKNFNQFIKTFC